MSYSHRGGAIGFGKNQNASNTSGPLSPLEQDSDVEQQSPAGPQAGCFSMRTLCFVNVVAFVTDVVIAFGVGMHGSKWLDGISNNADISYQYLSLLTPADWTFAVIWPIIFLFQAVWVLQQFCIPWGPVDSPKDGEVVQQTTARDAVMSVGYQYLISVITQASWTICFGKDQIIASTVLMVILWINLLTIVIGLERTLTYDRQAPDMAKVRKYMFEKLPFALHFGWITVALAVNINLLLVKLEVGPNGQFITAVSCILLLLILAFLGMCLGGLLTAPLVFSWGLIGVFSNLVEPEYWFSQKFSIGQLHVVQTASLGVAIIILLSVMVQGFCLYKKHRVAQKEEEEYLSKEERGPPVYYKAPY